MINIFEGQFSDYPLIIKGGNCDQISVNIAKIFKDYIVNSATFVSLKCEVENREDFKYIKLLAECINFGHSIIATNLMIDMMFLERKVYDKLNYGEVYEYCIISSISKCIIERNLFEILSVFQSICSEDMNKEICELLNI